MGTYSGWAQNSSIPGGLESQAKVQKKLRVLRIGDVDDGDNMHMNNTAICI